MSPASDRRLLQLGTVRAGSNTAKGRPVQVRKAEMSDERDDLSRYVYVSTETVRRISCWRKPIIDGRLIRAARSRHRARLRCPGWRPVHHIAGLGGDHQKPQRGSTLSWRAGPAAAGRRRSCSRAAPTADHRVAAERRSRGVAGAERLGRSRLHVDRADLALPRGLCGVWHGVGLCLGRHHRPVRARPDEPQRRRRRQRGRAAEPRL